MAAEQFGSAGHRWEHPYGARHARGAEGHVSRKRGTPSN